MVENVVTGGICLAAVIRLYTQRQIVGAVGRQAFGPYGNRNNACCMPRLDNKCQRCHGIMALWKQSGILVDGVIKLCYVVIFEHFRCFYNINGDVFVGTC